MKRLLLLWFLPVMIFCEVEFTIGTSMTGNTNDQTMISMDDKLYGGLFWEITSNHLGIGMTYDVTFNHKESNYDLVETDWWIDWSASADFNYHFLGNMNILDPHIGYSIGVNSLQKLYWYDRINSGWEESEQGVYTYEGENQYIEGQPTELITIFGKITGGLSLHLDTFFIGSLVQYRVMEMNLFQEMDDVDILEPLSAAISIGLRF